MANWLMYGESAYGELTMAKRHVAKRRRIIKPIIHLISIYLKKSYLETSVNNFVDQKIFSLQEMSSQNAGLEQNWKIFEGLPDVGPQILDLKNN